MTAPQSYENVTINVNPTDIQTTSDQLLGGGPGGDGNGMLGHIVDNILAIQQVITDQKLGWAGQTKDEATAFFQRWQTVMTSLFGSKDTPDAGSITRVAMAIQIAANNYNSAVDGAVNTFNSIANPASGTTSLSAPSSTPTWWSQTAVAEVF